MQSNSALFRKIMARNSWRTDNDGDNVNVSAGLDSPALWGFALAKASEQFRQSDVTYWGLAALCVGAIAVMGANVSAMIPQSILAGLHKTRLDGATIDQLREQVSTLRNETGRLQRENDVLTARFTLGEQNDSAVTQRVGALEVSMPRLIEALPMTADIDRSSFTSSIGEGQSLVYDTEGGSVRIRQQPLVAAKPETGSTQPLPAALPEFAAAAIPAEASFGIAVGPSILSADAATAWEDLSIKLGPLLFGLSPLLVDEANSAGKRIVVGPITRLSEATSLCQRLERVAISCLPMPYTGTPLAN